MGLGDLYWSDSSLILDLIYQIPFLTGSSHSGLPDEPQNKTKQTNNNNNNNNKKNSLFICKFQNVLSRVFLQFTF